METVKKIAPTPLKSQRTTHLENLLLSRSVNYQKSTQRLVSRLEAESRIEKFLQNFV